MKANWKIALLCLATLTVVACKDKKDPFDPGVDPSYVSPINVKDNSVADWDALDQTKVAVSNITDEPYWDGLKQLKVYSDGVYINYLIVFDPTKYTSHAGMADGMHLYMDIDLSDATGGFFDEFADAAADFMFEGALFTDTGSPISYSPTKHRWVGPEGGLPSERIGWEDVWEPVGTIKGESQFVGDSIIEGRLLVEYISSNFSEEGFGIGVDLQQNWGSIGLLPQIDAQGENGEAIGRTNMLKVTFDWPEEEEE